MTRLLNLSLVPTAELIEIRNVLKYGAKAYASKAGDEARKLRKELAELKHKNEVRDTVLDFGLDYDDDSDYYLDLDKQGALELTCKKLAEAKKQSASAEESVLKIPPMFNTIELSGKDFVRQELAERKRR